MQQTPRSRRTAASIAAAVLAASTAVAVIGLVQPASAGDPKPRNACELTFSNDTTMYAELDSAQTGGTDRWTARPTGDLRPNAQRTFSAEDWQAPGACRISVSYRFYDNERRQVTTAFGLVVNDGNEADVECNVFNDTFKCTSKRDREGSTVRGEVVFRAPTTP